LVDKAGTIRAGLTVGADGKAGLVLADQEGRILAGLGVTPDGSPGLALADKDGVRRAGLAIASDGTVRLDLTDKKGQTRAELAVLDYGSPVLFLRGNDGTPRALFGFMGDLAPTITLTDQNGRPRAELAFTDAGLPHLAILDKDDKSSAWLMISQDGSPLLRLKDQEGNLRSLGAAVLAGDPEPGRQVAERVRKEKPRAEADALSREVAENKRQLASVRKALVEMQKQINQLQQGLPVAQPKREQEKVQETAGREEADQVRKDAIEPPRPAEKVDRTVDEQDHATLLNQALAYTSRNQPGDQERAETAYRGAVQIATAKNVQDPVIYNAYGTFLQQQKRLDEAESFYKRALEINPKYGKALFNLGTLYESRGDLKQALEKYKAAEEAGLPQGREQYLRLRSTLKQ
ncbi:MAG: tetratricopeptide repeat protein, partial [candidate division NC10 bacterium]|nr:tetratricopeptide repeat protein [candidate division NC10 bacterium]